MANLQIVEEANLQNLLVEDETLSRVLDNSRGRWLQVEELQTLFENDELFQGHIMEGYKFIGVTSGLFRVKSGSFKDGNHWDDLGDGDKVRSKTLRSEPGREQLKFNVGLAQRTGADGQVFRRLTIRLAKTYQKVTFIHYAEV